MATAEHSKPVGNTNAPELGYGAGGRRLFTVHDYQAMGQAGIFGAEERTELIDGEVICMSPMGPLHAEVVDRLSEIFGEQSQGLARVRVQGPAQLNAYSEPLPDLLLLRKKPGGYGKAHPQPGEVLLLVEVSDSSLSSDRKLKIPRYAAAGIPEVWVVDIQSQCVEQYLGLNSGVYQKSSHSISDHIESTGLPKIRFEVVRLFS